jgi:hypothetical protein
MKSMQCNVELRPDIGGWSPLYNLSTNGIENAAPISTCSVVAGETC